MPCVSLTGEEKLNLAFLSEILLSLRNGTSSSHLSYCCSPLEKDVRHKALDLADLPFLMGMGIEF